MEKRIFWSSCILLIFFTNFVFGQITGKVEDEYGPLSGAIVSIKKTSLKTETNNEGMFSIKGNLGDIIKITHPSTLSEKTFKVTKLNMGVINLKEKEINLDVVVGYGTQKKVNLTGAVSAVKVDEITKGRPINNLASGLSGAVSGIYVPTIKGPAGKTPNINVRGFGTLSATAPLYVIDGVVSDGFDAINPEDVESISVLKDAASASIYGSRAANGVILITTKQGKAGKITLKFNSYAGITSMVDVDAIAPVSNYAEYMRLINESYTNSGEKAPYSEEKIKEWENAGNSNPLKYPNVDWRNSLFRKAISNNYSVSLSGGVGKTTFFSSFRYTDDPGVIENTGMKRSTFRLNLETEIRPWISVGSKINASLRKVEQGADEVKNMFKYLMSTSPGMVFRSPDGRYGTPSNDEEDKSVGANNPLIRLNNSEGETQIYDATFNFYSIIKPLKGLSIRSSYTYDGELTKNWNKPVYLDRWDFYNDIYMPPLGSKQTSITKRLSEKSKQYMDVVATYKRNFFHRLDLSTILGASQEKYEYYYDIASKKDLLSPEFTVPDAAIGEASFSGNQTTWAMRSVFARLNLGWDNKYLLELNLRNDGSSRFRKDYRWGLFPSASIGWRIDQESFMESLKEKGLDALKLRLSYGSLGNNSVGDYEALSVYNSAIYVLNDIPQPGFALTRFGNPYLTWEKTYVANIGVDFALLRNRLSGTVDLFDKTAKDILIELPAPWVHGSAKVPRQNSAQVRNRGVELQLTWQDRVGAVDYFVKGNFSYIKNKVLRYKGDIGQIFYGKRYLKEGLPIYPAYAYEYDRIIQTPKDLEIVKNMLSKRPDAFPKGVPGMGDLLYKDLNGDGRIDDNDRRTFEEAGWTYPYLCGMSIGMNWKGIDFSITAQGNFGLKSFYEAPHATTSMRQGYQINKNIAEGRWVPGRTDATYPRLLTQSYKNNTLPSNFWFSDRSFVKIKNIQIGYTLPKKVLKTLSLSSLRVYASLENYFTFTSWKGIDPETPKLEYPTMRQALFGINLTL